MEQRQNTKGLRVRERHANVALFVPHAGCPHQCSFCNQRAISGKQVLPDEQDVERAVQTALQSGADPNHSEIAFFGGSFTAIDREYMLRLLHAAEPYCRAGHFRGIRISTRPDCVSDGMLSLLKAHCVTSIELGAQSMCDSVLQKNGRGHTAQDTRAACARIKAHGFSLGLQMMTGLPGDDGGATHTARELIALAPDTVRIYPTVVLKGTDLAKLYARGEYLPQTLGEAVSLCAELLLLFHSAGVKVIRAGLHSGGEVASDVVAGPYHPAFRELCEGEIYFRLARDEILSRDLSGALTIKVNPSERSKMAGQKRKNLLRLRELGADCRVAGNSALDKYEIMIHL
ncbi:MAG: radical SAM protein [Oscillospiraceae bacterium]|jgi:histone acetyltransferase (RNA polymerase elongator complex component)|nr:radical SAM protein [Oscillospiraceae bacterium]